MKRIYQPIIYLLPLAFLFSCISKETEVQPVHSSGDSRTKIKLSEKMKKYEDNDIRFEFPENIEVDVMKTEEQSFYTLTTPTADPNQNFNFSICLETGNPYLSGMNKEELTEIYNSDTHPRKFEIVHSDILTTNSGQNTFYLVQKHQEDVPFNYKISFFSPVGKTQTGYSLMGNNLLDSASYVSVSKTLVEIIKSIEIKSINQ